MIFHRLECVVGLIFFFSLLFCRLEYRSHRSRWYGLSCHCCSNFHCESSSDVTLTSFTISDFPLRFVRVALTLHLLDGFFCRLFSRICVVSFLCPHRRYVPLIFFSIFFCSFHYFILLLCAVLFICRMYSLPFCLSLKMCCCLFLLCLFWWIFSASWCVCLWYGRRIILRNKTQSFAVFFLLFYLWFVLLWWLLASFTIIQFQCGFCG